MIEGNAANAEWTAIFLDTAEITSTLTPEQAALHPLAQGILAPLDGRMARVLAAAGAEDFRRYREADAAYEAAMDVITSAPEVARGGDRSWREIDLPVHRKAIETLLDRDVPDIDAAEGRRLLVEIDESCLPCSLLAIDGDFGVGDDRDSIVGVHRYIHLASGDGCSVESIEALFLKLVPVSTAPDDFQHGMFKWPGFHVSAAMDDHMEGLSSTATP